MCPTYYLLPTTYYLLLPTTYHLLRTCARCAGYNGPPPRGRGPARRGRALGARSTLAARGTQSRLAALKKPQRHLALAHKTEIDDERMPTTYADYSNHVLLMLSAHGDEKSTRNAHCTR